MEDKKSVSITEAAEINSVTRQAIYIAITKKRLKARKDSRHWLIDLVDLEEYRRSRYSRNKLTYNGELLFDNDKGYYSVNQAAKMLGVPAQKIYYETRIGTLPFEKKGGTLVLKLSDIENFKVAS